MQIPTTPKRLKLRQGVVRKNSSLQQKMARVKPIHSMVISKGHPYYSKYHCGI